MGEFRFDKKAPENLLSSSPLVIKALRELGPKQLGLYALYQIGLKAGYFRWRTGGMPAWIRRSSGRSSQASTPEWFAIRPLLEIPTPAEVIDLIREEGLTQVVRQADEIVNGKVRLFWGEPVPLVLAMPGNLTHWTAYESGRVPLPSPTSTKLPVTDIKYIWEPGRFGWTFTLGRAYHLTGDERYPQAFWQHLADFQEGNPIHMGPNWSSGQEIGLRILALTFAAQIFRGSHHTTKARKLDLGKWIAAHAGRIPVTLLYARAQNNNHLLSEAAGLITASLAIPDHPEAPKWRQIGWKWFNRGLETQISADGTYMQHSTNYHRLMLQLALWVHAIQPDLPSGKIFGGPGSRIDHLQQLSVGAVDNLHQATTWLVGLTDRQTGRVPNLGPNDGAYILPLSALPFGDYRPVVQAAAQAFWGEPVFGAGVWDEMGRWLNLRRSKPKEGSTKEIHPPHRPKDSSMVLIHPKGRSRAYLRAVRFNSRPGHADQLHLDLWWRGLNIAQDPGTYSYNADPPWDNALTHTAVHNTVMVDGSEQMTRAGRFLYLDRAQAEIVSHDQADDGSWVQVYARHDGYLRSGVRHSRKVTADKEDRWVVEDLIQPLGEKNSNDLHMVRLHWLLPDWPYKWLEPGHGLRIHSPFGWVFLAVTVLNENPDSIPDSQYSLVRAGKLLHGSEKNFPTWGWFSPTYGVKVPALSFGARVQTQLPITLVTKWSFPNG